MKIECSTENLKNAVTKLERITTKQSTLPILSSFYIQAKDKSILIRATNLLLGGEILIPANVLEEGECVVPAEIFSHVIINSGIDSIISLEKTNSDGLSIKTKTIQTVVNGSGLPEDFPTIPAVEGVSVSLSAEQFLEGVKSVYYSSSQTEIKPEIASVYMYTTEEGELVFVATDSFRLAEKKIFSVSLPYPFSLLLPYKNVLDIIRLIEGSDDSLEITLNDNQVSFSLPGLYITSRSIQGIFPDYKQIIPKEFKTEVVILKQDILNALRLANIFSDKFNQITFSIIPKDKNIVLSAKNSEVGETSTTLPCHVEGDEIIINFNYKYFSDCFQSVTTDSIELYLNEINRPVIIKGNGDRSFTYLIMPMNR